MSSPKEIRNGKLAATVIEALQERKFEAYYCPTSEEAVKKALSMIPSGASVGWGGSDTIRATGLYQAVYDAGVYTIYDRDVTQSPEERADMQRKALLSDVFLMSANAISEDGYLVNIDGGGNRVSALSYGPKNVIVLAGLNKVANTLEDAIVRAQYVAAPINTQRFSDSDIPCVKTGVCTECMNDACICNYISIVRRCIPPGKIKVILIGEDWGY